MKYFVTVNGREHEVEVVERSGELEVGVDGQALELDYEEVDRLGQVALFSQGRSWGMSIEGDEYNVLATIAGHQYEVEIEDERERAAHAAEREAAGGGGAIESVMPGVVVQLLVQVGDSVEEGRPLLILEAMKMQNEIAAPSEGVVEAIHVTEGQVIESGVRLVTLSGCQ